MGCEGTLDNKQCPWQQETNGSFDWVIFQQAFIKMGLKFKSHVNNWYYLILFVGYVSMSVSLPALYAGCVLTLLTVWLTILERPPCCVDCRSACLSACLPVCLWPCLRYLSQIGLTLRIQLYTCIESVVATCCHLRQHITRHKAIDSRLNAADANRPNRLRISTEMKIHFIRPSSLPSLPLSLLPSFRLFLCPCTLVSVRQSACLSLRRVMLMRRYS